MKSESPSFFCTLPSPVGELTLASDGENLTGLWIKDQKYFLARLPRDSKQRTDIPVFDRTREWLALYFEGKDPGTLPPLKPEGSDFRKSVWKLLAEIPYGKTVTYGALAEEMAKQRGIAKMSSRAVGGAVGHNPISIIIPCHRVIGAGGNLTGYGGGIDRKIALLRLEGLDTSLFKIPTRGTAL